MRILVINGPNMNLLGLREPEIYGEETYEDLVRYIAKEGRTRSVEVECFQSNHEGAIIDEIQRALEDFDGIIINPAAYTHTSIAIGDALLAVGLPCVEVHITDPTKREEYRKISYVKEACIATVSGQGIEGYVKAMDILIERLQR